MLLSKHTGVVALLKPRLLWLQGLRHTRASPAHALSDHQINDTDPAAFITGTMVDDLPVSSTRDYVEFLVNSPIHLRKQRGWKIIAWANLDNRNPHYRRKVFFKKRSLPI